MTDQTPRSQAYPLRRREVVRRLVEADSDLLVIAGLGSTAWDVTSAGDRDLNFPLWGAMGGAIPMGLGLALARPDRRVLVVTGCEETLVRSIFDALGLVVLIIGWAPSWRSRLAATEQL